MSNIQSIQHEIEELRYRDMVKELTASGAPNAVQNADEGKLIHLLEVADALQATQEVKFHARSFFIALVRNPKDDQPKEVQDSSQLKTTIYHAFKTYSEAEEFHTFLSNEKISSLHPYFQSPNHQQIQERIQQLAGPFSSMSTPYDYAALIKKSNINAGVEKTVRQFIDFSLTIFQTCQLSSEEIFVGCYLMVCSTPHLSSLLILLETHFQSSLVKGRVLKQLIEQQIQVSMSEGV